MIKNIQLDRLENKIDNLINIINDNKIELSRQHHDLYGNGKKGLIARVEDTENIISLHNKYFYGIMIIISIFQFIGIDIKTFINK